ncbi:ORF6N domain-containing protein [Clostridium tyrobutyricum]|uniref:ORF6N domain-containing protein n=1 Tax=Clostridium tyrobutyricum TaxID=1519 RepID=UPI001C381FCE|nr:ORF6N domain-containing protein [Clostridium tyrobutyricum]MBV4429400.1 ORF6N domain-containing protein [Clostridium tyrobutyricum]MBV4443027.1 ORF6N domain-containing protein [Clostridium tyrobutyricum]
MNNLVHINGEDLQIKEFNGQRVITFRDIDNVHSRVKGTAKRNFNDNKYHFIKDEDYFEITKKEVGTDFVHSFGFDKFAPNGILITESGYLMLVKSFTDDLAWSIQRQLVNNYFKIKGFKSTPHTLTEIIRLIRETRLIMKEQGCSPRDIAIAVKQICDQNNVKLPDCFVKPEETTLNDVYDMIDYIFSVPKKDRKKLTYDDFIVEKTVTLKLNAPKRNELE